MENSAREAEQDNQMIVSNLYNINEKLNTSIKRANQWKDYSKNRALALNMRVHQARLRNKDCQTADPSQMSISQNDSQPEIGSRLYDSLLASV